MGPLNVPLNVPQKAYITGTPEPLCFLDSSGVLQGWTPEVFLGVIRGLQGNP